MLELIWKLPPYCLAFIVWKFVHREMGWKASSGHSRLWTVHTVIPSFQTICGHWYSIDTRVMGINIFFLSISEVFKKDTVPYYRPVKGNG